MNKSPAATGSIAEGIEMQPPDIMPWRAQARNIPNQKTAVYAITLLKKSFILLMHPQNKFYHWACVASKNLSQSQAVPVQSATLHTVTEELTYAMCAPRAYAQNATSPNGPHNINFVMNVGAINKKNVCVCGLNIFFNDTHNNNLTFASYAMFA